MKNKHFTDMSLAEKKSSLARVIKRNTRLPDNVIVDAVNSIDVSKQYIIKKTTKEDFSSETTPFKKVINKTESWEESIERKSNVIYCSDDGGIAVVEDKVIGSLDIGKRDKTLSIICF